MKTNLSPRQSAVVALLVATPILSLSEAHAVCVSTPLGNGVEVVATKPIGQFAEECRAAFSACASVSQVAGIKVGTGGGFVSARHVLSCIPGAPCAPATTIASCSMSGVASACSDAKSGDANECLARADGSFPDVLTVVTATCSCS